MLLALTLLATPAVQADDCAIPTPKHPAQMTAEELEVYATAQYPEYVTCRDQTLAMFESAPVTIASLDTAIEAIGTCKDAASADLTTSMADIQKHREEKQTAENTYRRIREEIAREKLLARTAVQRNAGYAPYTPREPMSETTKSIVERAKLEQAAPATDPRLTEQDAKYAQAQVAIEADAATIVTASWVTQDAGTHIEDLKGAKEALKTEACTNKTIDADKVGVTCPRYDLLFSVSDSPPTNRWP